MQPKTPALSKSHRGEQVYTGGQQVSYDVPAARLADRDDCPHYAACLAKAAHARAKSGAAQSVCEGCTGTPRPTLDELVRECAAKHGTNPGHVRTGKKWREAAAARRDVWARGNLLGYTDTELARATGVTRSSVGEWLDQPRSKR